MKRLLLIFGFLLFIATYSQSVFAQSSGTFMVVKGEVQVKSKTGEVQKAKIGMKVTALDTITSGAEGRAKIVMSDQNVINISPDTIMTLEKYIYDPAKDDKQVTLNVLQGKVRATVEQKYDGEKNKFHVKTPSAVAGVRGTDFLTSYSPKTQEMKLVTFQGTVAVGVAGPGGSIANPVFVKPGESTTAMRGAPPAPPVPVPAKELSSMNTESSADTAGKPAPAAAATTTDEKDKDKDKDKDKNQDKEQEKEKDPAQKEEKKDEKKEDKKEQQDKKESQDKQESQDKKENQDKAESKDKQEPQDKAESKDKQEPQDKKEPQEKKETQDKKEPQDKKETKEANKESGSSKEGGKQDQAKQESTSQKESAQKESGGAKEGGPSAKSESGSGSSKGGNKQEPSGSASNKEAGSSTTSNNASSGPKTEERGPASVQGQNPPSSNAKTAGPGQPPPPPPSGGGMMPPPPTMIDTRDLDVGGISNTVIQNNYAPPPAMINFTNPATRQDLTQPPKNEFMNSTIQQTQKATVNITIEKPK